MADNTVFISGVADGAFQEALGDLPPWATEDTALSIEQHLRKSLGIQTKLLSEAIKCCKGKGSGSGNIAADEVRKVNDELGKMLRNVKKQNEEADKSYKRKKLAEKADEVELANGKKTNTSGAILTSIFGDLSVLGSKVLDTEREYVDVYDSLYKSGINVLNGNEKTTNGFKALNELVNQTGLRLQVLQAVAAKYTSSINAVGMMKFGKAVGMSLTKMNDLGYSSEESAELIGAMIESEQSYSDVRNKSAEQFSADAIRLGDQFTKLSLATGISRQQLLDNMKTSAQSADSTLVAAKWGEQAAKNVTEAAAGIKDANVRNMIEKMAAASDPVFTKLYKDLNAAGLGDFGNQLGNLAKDMRSGISPLEVQNRMKAILDALSPGRISPLTDQIAAGNAAAQSSIEVISTLLEQSRNLTKATGDQTNAATTTEASVARLQSSIESASATLQKIFFPLVEHVNGMAAAITLANTGTQKFIDGADKFADILNTKLFPSIVKVAESLGILDKSVDNTIKVTGAELRSWLGVGLSILALGAAAIIAIKSLRMFSLLSKSKIDLPSGGTGKKGAILRTGRMIGNLIKGSISGIVNIVNLSKGLLLNSMTGIGKIFKWFGGIFKSAGSSVVNTFIEVGKSVYSFLLNTSSGIINGLKAFMTRATSTFGNAISWVADIFKGAGSWISQTIKNVFGSAAKIIGSAGNWIQTALRSVGTAISSAFNNVGKWFIKVFKGVFSGASTFLGKIFSKIGILFGDFLPIVSKVGGFALRFAGVLGALYTAFEIGYGIGTMIKGWLDKFSSVTDAFETVFYGIDLLLSKIPGFIGEEARYRVKMREEAERALKAESETKTPESKKPAPAPKTPESKKQEPAPAPKTPESKKPVEISAPKTPMMSTVNSPSAVSTTESKPANVPLPSETPETSVTGIEKPNNTSNINSLLGYQTKVLENILEQNRELVSVNKDILRYARTQ